MTHDDENDDHNNRVQSATSLTKSALPPSYHHSVKCHCGSVRGKFRLRTDKHDCGKDDDQEAKVAAATVVAWNCNCSDCSMRGNVHIIIPGDDFRLDLLVLPDGTSPLQERQEQQQERLLEDRTILYEWGTKVAKRRFCKRCGILPWYRPRSNPDGIAITLNCIEWGDDGGGGGGGDDSVVQDKGRMRKRQKLTPIVEIRSFDGIHWEESFAASKITQESKK